MAAFPKAVFWFFGQIGGKIDARLFSVNVYPIAQGPQEHQLTFLGDWLPFCVGAILKIACYRHTKCLGTILIFLNHHFPIDRELSLRFSVDDMACATGEIAKKATDSDFIARRVRRHHPL